MTAGSSSAIPTAPDFDVLARVYRWMEWLSFGPFLGFCRSTYLREMRGSKRALVIGDGDGRFTARLLSENQNLKVDAVDASAAMLSVLVGRNAEHTLRLRTYCMDARQWRSETATADIARYDLIVTHFLLDCLTTREVRSLAERVRAAAAPSALWVVSEFAIPDGWFGKLVARPVVGLLYVAFGWITGLTVRQLPDYADALRSVGFRRIARRSRLAGLLVSQLWAHESET